jgi:FHS family L-fucose permease-like MFS transporter
MALPTPDPSSIRPLENSGSGRNPYLLPFALVCSLFFLWGIANSLNGSLVKHFQFALDLKRWKSAIVDSAFYLGYFVMALPAGYFMRRFGYKRGILAGLLLYAGGAFLFYPAAEVGVYAVFLIALFTIASGLAFLETAANLYVTVLGDPARREWRINFAQSFNGISIILGPVIGSLLIFSSVHNEENTAGMTADQIEAARQASLLTVQTPYLAVGALVLLVAILFAATRMPEVGREEEQAEGSVSILGLLRRYRHLTLGVLAQFANVGAQVVLWSFFANWKLDFSPNQHLTIVEWIYPTEGKTLEQIAELHRSFALVLFMIGRFVGTFLMSYMPARRVLAWYTVAAVVFLAVAMATDGLTSIVFISLAYFCQSIMFPTIFALATDQLPPAESKLASSLVIMAIVGGAVMPPLAGALSDYAADKHLALIVPLLLFAYIVWYTVRGYRPVGTSDYSRRPANSD